LILHLFQENSIDNIQLVGSGSFSDVYSISLKQNNEIKKAAWKRITPKKGSLKYEINVDQYHIISEFPEELDTLRDLQECAGIIKLYGWIASFKDNIVELSMVVELCEKDLSKVIFPPDSTSLTADKKKKFILQITEAMKFVHSKGYLHRDLKPDNILVDQKYNIKIADFGLSRKMIVSSGITNRGTPLYMAPELLAANGYDKPVDVWSFGLIVWEIFNAKVVFKGLEFDLLGKEQYDHFKRDNRPSLNEGNIEPKMANLLKRCWAFAPLKRPTFAQISEEFSSNLSHFFTS